MWFGSSIQRAIGVYTCVCMCAHMCMCMCMCACVHVCAHACVQVCTHVHSWEGQRIAPVIFCNCCPAYFQRQVFSLHRSSPIQPDRLASPRLGSSCLYLLRAGITSMHCGASVFNEGIGGLNSGLQARPASTLPNEPSPQPQRNAIFLR